MGTALVVAACLVTGPSSAEAQSWRIQGAWVAGHVGGAVLGAEWRRPLGPEPELPLPGVGDQDGPIEVSTRNWLFTGMVAGGVNVAPPENEGDVRPLIYGHGGVLYRTGSSIVSRVGAVGAFYAPAGAVGPAALIEAGGVIDLQGGVLYTDAGWKGHGALTISLSFLHDIFGG
jgi:hypothetical protein